VGDPQRLVVVGRPGDVDLQDHRLALPAALAERGDDALQALARLVDRRQAVRPAPDPARGLGRHRGAHERRRLGGQRPQPAPVDVDEAVVGDLLPASIARMTCDALGQARVALGLGRPAGARDVLVGRLPRPEADPQAPGEHLGERRHGLGDDRRVVALARGVDDPERQRRGGQRRPEPRPGEAGLALALAPRGEVVRRHADLEARLLGEPDVLEQPARGDLLVGGVPTDARHERRTVPCAGARGKPPPGQAATPDGAGLLTIRLPRAQELAHWRACPPTTGGSRATPG
jgi:hypothetical protein